MEIRPPCIITARLLPGIRIASASLSISQGPRDHDGRTVYTYHIDLPGGISHTASDLRSGVGGGTWQQGLESLLSFLAAAAESSGTSDNSSLFPPAVTAWARDNSDAISMAACELEERA